MTKYPVWLCTMINEKSTAPQGVFMRKLIRLPFPPTIGLQISCGTSEVRGRYFQETPIRELVWRMSDECFTCWIDSIDARTHNQSASFFVNMLADLGWQVFMSTDSWRVD